MAYFKEFPIIRYPSFLTGKNSSLDYVEVANLFRRVKLREDIQKKSLSLINMKSPKVSDQTM